MAKRMALVEEGVVSNLLWCSDGEPETQSWKEVLDRPVGIGDTYTDGKFYRDGKEVLTPLEAAQAEARTLQQALEELDSAYVEGVNSL